MGDGRAGSDAAAIVSARERSRLRIPRRAPCLAAANRRWVLPFTPARWASFVPRCDPLVCPCGLPPSWGTRRRPMCLFRTPRLRCGGGRPSFGPRARLVGSPSVASRSIRPLWSPWALADAVDLSIRGPSAPASLSPVWPAVVAGWNATMSGLPLCPPSAGRGDGRGGVPASLEDVCYLVDPASSHMLVSKIKPCMCKYELIQTVKLRMAH